MGYPERYQNSDNETREKLISPFIVNYLFYTGPSERIKGFQRIKEAIGAIAGVDIVAPIVLLTATYEEYKNYGLSEKFNLAIKSVWDYLEGEKHPLIVRRLFPNKEGKTQDGPRSGNITSREELFSEVTRFYQFFDQHYLHQEILPEIMVHRIVNTINPPKSVDPFLPFPGGDVIPLTEHKFQVRATFGSDESVQGFSPDVWEVTFHSNGFNVTQTVLAQKTAALIPGKDVFQRIALPPQFQEAPALNNVQVLSVAEVCRNINQRLGSHRLEFDGTIINGQETLVIIESVPFLLPTSPKEKILGSLPWEKKPMTVFRQEEDLKTIPEKARVFVHVPETHFQGNERREALTRLSLTASEKGTQLVVFAAGNIATQHAVRVLVDSGHQVFFVGEEKFTDNEIIRLFAKDGDVSWERENPIVLQENMEGRTINRVGGKALGLHKLEKHGFKVPHFFTIETSLFRQMIKEAGLTDLVFGLDMVEIEKIRPISQTITDQILQYQGSLPVTDDLIDRLGSDHFVIRSSANYEDGQFSFAGIFKTCLNITRQEIKDANLQVLASTLSEEAVRAARFLHIKPSRLQMALINQEMIMAKKAGTIFTKDHLTDDENVLRIEAKEGGGESIVNGTAKNIQRIGVDKKTRKIIDEEGKEILNQQEKERIINHGLEVEARLKEGPQDIEWLIDDKNEIISLQTRHL